MKSKAKMVVYRHFNAQGILLYVGLSSDPLQRNCGHAVSSRWFSEVARIELSRFESREAAALEEIRAIREERPIHNVSTAISERPPSADRDSYSIRDASRILGVPPRAVARLLPGADSLECAAPGAARLVRQELLRRSLGVYFRACESDWKMRYGHPDNENRRGSSLE